MVPAVSGRYPVIALSSEVLPEPLAPRITQCCPASTRQSMRSRITASRSTRSPSISITALLMLMEDHHHKSAVAHKIADWRLEMDCRLNCRRMNNGDDDEPDPDRAPSQRAVD